MLGDRLIIGNDYDRLKSTRPTTRDGRSEYHKKHLEMEQEIADICLQCTSEKCSGTCDEFTLKRNIILRRYRNG